MKTFIANLPILLGEILYKLSAVIVDFGIKLHIRWDTELGKAFAKFRQDMKKMAEFSKTMESTVKEAMKNPQKNEDSKLSDIIKGDN